jgi:NAD(P)H-dependent FMN reductase
MLKIGIILGSTRPGRRGEAVAQWTLKQLEALGGAKFELVDLQDFNLPIYDEPHPPYLENYTKEHTKRWSSTIRSFDGYVFVTPEYNHSTSGALKNALDFLMNEWANKAAAFVGYGSAQGARAVEHLRQMMSELRVATTRTQLGFSLFTDFENFKEFKPGPQHQNNLKALHQELLAWSEAMIVAREKLSKIPAR